MRLKYSLTQDDVFLFNKHLLMKEKNLEKARKMFIATWIALPFLFVLFMLFLVNFEPDPFIIIATIIMFLALSGFSIFKIFRDLTKKRFFGKKLEEYLKGKDISNYLGINEVTIDENGIHRTSRTSDGWVFWNGISKIEETEEAVYAFLTDSSAFLFPARLFRDENDKKGFIKAVRNLHLKMKDKEPNSLLTQ